MLWNIEMVNMFWRGWCSCVMDRSYQEDRKGNQSVATATLLLCSARDRLKWTSLKMLSNLHLKMLCLPQKSGYVYFFSHWPTLETLWLLVRKKLYINLANSEGLLQAFMLTSFFPFSVHVPWNASPHAK